MVSHKRLIPDLYLEKMVLGELPENTLRNIQKEWDAETIQKGCERIHRSNLELSASPFQAQVLQQIKRSAAHWEYRPKSAPRLIHFRIPKTWGIALSAVGTIAAIIWIAPDIVNQFQAAPIEMEQTDKTRAKGLGPRLTVFRKKGDTSERLNHGAMVSEHDLLQLSYLAAKRKYGTVLSIDGAAAVTLHFPSHENASNLLTQDGNIMLPYSYELDAAPGFERFFFVTSDKAFATLDVIKSARIIAKDPTQAAKKKLPLPEGFQQTSLLLIKVSK